MAAEPGDASPLDPESSTTAADWKTFVDFQPNGRILRNAPVRNAAGIDLWAPDGACEEMLIQQGALQVRKRQQDGRCRVDGCERLAPKAPFLCDYHASGEFYTVAVMDLERESSRWINIKLCRRLPKHWEYLKNFTRKKNGKFNLTCRLCCVKASSYVPKRGGRRSAARAAAASAGGRSRASKRARNGNGLRRNSSSASLSSAADAAGTAAQDTARSVRQRVGAPSTTDVPREPGRAVEVLFGGAPIGTVNIRQSTTLRQCRDSLLPRMARPPNQAFVFVQHGSPVDPGSEALVLASEVLEAAFAVPQLHIQAADTGRRGRANSRFSTSTPHSVSTTGHSAAAAASFPRGSATGGSLDTFHQFGDAFGEPLLGTTVPIADSALQELSTLGGFGAVDTPALGAGAGYPPFAAPHGHDMFLGMPPQLAHSPYSPTAASAAAPRFAMPQSDPFAAAAPPRPAVQRSDPFAPALGGGHMGMAGGSGAADVRDGAADAGAGLGMDALGLAGMNDSDDTGSMVGAPAAGSTAVALRPGEGSSMGGGRHQSGRLVDVRGALHGLTATDCPEGFAFPAGHNCEQELMTRNILLSAASATTSNHCRIVGCASTPTLPSTHMCAYHSQNAVFMVEMLDRTGRFVRCLVRFCTDTHKWHWLSAFTIPRTTVKDGAAASATAGDAAAASATVGDGAAAASATVGDGAAAASATVGDGAATASSATVGDAATAANPEPANEAAASLSTVSA